MMVVKSSALRTGRLYPPPRRKYSRYSFLLEVESTPEPQCGWKDYVNEKLQMTLSGIEPATSRIVVQCLNQMRHRVLPKAKTHLEYVLFIALLQQQCLHYAHHCYITRALPNLF